MLAAPSQSPASQDALAARRALWTAAAIGDGLLVPRAERAARSRTILWPTTAAPRRCPLRHHA
ncbi:hypothetical protein AWV79_04205 [Cupriavidus sp. UYMMa02A]|nr:hypothetical protein AWV79_04205 [Cupriavidus sp. UYMMa02A]